jgi:hypothetical protein
MCTIEDRLAISHIKKRKASIIIATPFSPFCDWNVADRQIMFLVLVVKINAVKISLLSQNTQSIAESCTLTIRKDQSLRGKSRIYHTCYTGWEMHANHY